MTVKFRELSLALLAAGVLTLAACASTSDDPTTPPADATAPAEDASMTPPPADTTTPPPAADGTTPTTP